MQDSKRSKIFNRVVREQIAARNKLLNESRIRLTGILTLIQNEIVALLARQPSDFQQWHQGQLQQQIDAILARLVSDGTATLSEQLDTMRVLGSTILDKALEPAGVRLISSPILDENLLGNLKQLNTGRIKDISNIAQGKIELELAQVVLGAKSPYDAQRAVLDILSGEPVHRLDTIVNTALPSVFNNASESRYRQAGQVLPGLKKRWYHSGRGHARLTHRLAHLQTVDVDKPFQIGPVRMMHPHDPTAPAAEVIRCRCHHRPWMESWEVLAPAQKFDVAA